MTDDQTKKWYRVKRNEWRENNLERDREYMRRWRANKVEQMDERQRLLYRLARKGA